MLPRLYTQHVRFLHALGISSRHQVSTVITSSISHPRAIASAAETIQIEVDRSLHRRIQHHGGRLDVDVAVGWYLAVCIPWSERVVGTAGVSREDVTQSWGGRKILWRRYGGRSCSGRYHRCYCCWRHWSTVINAFSSEVCAWRRHRMFAVNHRKSRRDIRMWRHRRSHAHFASELARDWRNGKGGGVAGGGVVQQHLSLERVSPVLEPDLDLLWRHAQGQCELVAFAGRQVALRLEPMLQLVHLYHSPFQHHYHHHLHTGTREKFNGTGHGKVKEKGVVEKGKQIGGGTMLS